MKTEDLFNSKNDIRLCSACYGYGLNYNYFIADDTTKKVLKTISGEKFKELMDNNIFEYVEKVENVQSWRLKSKVMTEIEQAKQTLKDAGYQVDNLWHINDVQNNYNCTDEEAMEVLVSVLGKGYIMETVFDLISLEANEIGLTRKEQ